MKKNRWKIIKEEFYSILYTESKTRSKYTYFEEIFLTIKSTMSYFIIQAFEFTAFSPWLNSKQTKSENLLSLITKYKQILSWQVTLITSQLIMRILNKVLQNVSQSTIPKWSPHLGPKDPCPAIDKTKLTLFNMRYCPYAQRTVLLLDAKKILWVLKNWNLSSVVWIFNSMTSLIGMTMSMLMLCTNQDGFWSVIH